MVSIKARRDVRFRFYLPFSQCLLGVNTFLHRFANQYLSLPQVKVKPHYFPIWNSRCCSKLSCFSRSTSNICEWALKQVPRNSQVQRNVSRKRWKGKRALREPLWRSIVLHILSISLLLMISSQRRTDCGMRNISDLIFIWLLPARIIFFFFDEIKKMRARSRRSPMAAVSTTEYYFRSMFRVNNSHHQETKQFGSIDVGTWIVPASDSPCKAGQ